MSSILVPIFGAAAFLTGVLFYAIPTIPAVARYFGEVA